MSLYRMIEKCFHDGSWQCKVTFMRSVKVRRCIGPWASGQIMMSEEAR